MAASTWSTTDKEAGITLSGVNLVATQNQAVNLSGVRGKDPKRTGRFYFEASSTWTDTGTRVGLAMGGIALLNLAATAPFGDVYVRKDGGIFLNGVTTGLTLAALTNGNVVGIAVDLDARLIWFRLAPSGNWNGSATANPATGVGGTSIATAGLGGGYDAYPWGGCTNVVNDAITANFGGSAFSGTVPTGFTSGWDDTVTPVLNAVATQASVEEWAIPVSPDAWVTQVAVEQWSTVATGTVQAIATQVAIEQWASVAVITVPTTGPFASIIL